MRTEPPIACTLSAAEMPRRLAEMRAIGNASLVSMESTGSESVLRFRKGAETLASLRGLVAAERECCPFLALELADEPDAVSLTIRAPQGAEPVVRELLAEFSASEPPGRP